MFGASIEKDSILIGDNDNKYARRCRYDEMAEEEDTELCTAMNTAKLRKGNESVM